MDSFRFVLALVICMLILLGWGVWFGPQQAPRQAVAPAPQAPGAPEARPEARPAPAGPAAPAAQPPAEPEIPEKTEKIAIDGGGAGERLRLGLTSRSGGISSRAVTACA